MCSQKFGVALAPLFVIAALVSCGSVPETPVVPERQAEAIVEKPLSERDRVLALIVAALKKGDFDGAIALFDELPPEDLAKSDTTILKASVLLSAGRLPAAKTLVTELLKEESANVEALFVLSSVEKAGGNARGERLAIDQALKIDPNHEKTLVALGNLYIRSESWLNAAKTFEKALAQNASDLAALIGMTSALRKLKQHDAALSYANEAVKQHPDDAESYSARSRILRDAGLSAQALADLETAERLSGRDYWVIYDKGRVLLAMDKKAEALAAFDKASSIDPREFVAYIYSAGIKTDNGDFEGAEHDYSALAKANPDYFYAFEGLGMLKMRKKEYKEARDAFVAAYNKMPDEASYAILAALNALRVQPRVEVKPFLEKAMKPLGHNTLDYAMLRLLNDYTGDADLSKKIQTEKDPYIKGKTAFFLAEFYDITNKRGLADLFYEKCKEANRRDTIEWRLNEWIMEERSLLAGG